MNPVVSPDVWMAHSHWYRRTLAAEELGEMLTVSDRLLRMLPGFLQTYPPSRHVEARWSFADLYTYIFEHPEYGDPTAVVPRLFPHPTAPTWPARLIFTTSIEIAGGQEFVIHAWDPPDGRGHVAIGYPVRDCPGADTAEAARSLFTQLSWASALVIPANGPDGRRGHRRTQPAVWIIDGRSLVLGSDPNTSGVERGVWADAANLLRIDIPWWPQGLRERDAMLSWRPGDDPLAITPAVADRDPAALLDVLTPDSSTGLRHTVARMIRELEHELCGEFNSGRDRFESFPGLTHAAFAAVDQERPRSRTAGEAALFLHQQIPNPLIAARAAAVAGGYPIAHSAYVIKPSNRENWMIQEWLARLRPVSTARRDEIGFQLALSMLPAELGPDDHLSPTGYFTDTEWPDCWVVACGETVIVTCGVFAPARGVLRQAYLAAGVAFFVDSCGKPWPLPFKRARPTITDDDLAQGITRLMLDAGADVETVDGAVDTNPDVLKRIQTRPLPLVIDADDVMSRRPR